MRTRYRIDDFQETYFVIDGLDELLELAHIDFGPLYERVKGQPEFQPGDVLPTDGDRTRGTGAIIRPKNAPKETRINNYVSYWMCRAVRWCSSIPGGRHRAQC